MIRRFVTSRLHRAHRRWTTARLYYVGLDQRSPDRYAAFLDADRCRRRLHVWEWLYLHLWGES